MNSLTKVMASCYINHEVLIFNQLRFSVTHYSYVPWEGIPRYSSLVFLVILWRYEEMSFLGTFPHASSGIDGSTLTSVILSGQRVSSILTVIQIQWRVKRNGQQILHRFWKQLWSACSVFLQQGFTNLKKKSKNSLKIRGARIMSSRKMLWY
jgi:hypothetical protein